MSTSQPTDTAGLAGKLAAVIREEAPDAPGQDVVDALHMAAIQVIGGHFAAILLRRVVGSEPFK